MQNEIEVKLLTDRSSILHVDKLVQLVKSL